MRRRTSNEGATWQSFADLGLGLMAVFVLVAVGLLIHEQDQARSVEAERDDLRVLAEQIFESLEAARSIQARQDRVGEFLGRVLDETGCELRYDPTTRRLLPREGSESELYAPGDVQLSERGRAALVSCREAFVRIAGCFAPEGTSASARCGGTEAERQTLREDVEAVVLQGNTDRVPFGDAPYVRGIAAGRGTPTPRAAFVGNAYLGAERARQALGHLLAQVEASDVQDDDLLNLLFGRVRIESPSFGRYQAGLDPEPGCAPEEDACDSARNLSLVLRLKPERAQRPMREIVSDFCRRYEETPSLRVALASREARVHDLCAVE